MKKIFLIDPGHGGIIDGIYQTEGKRSPVWPDESQLFEGEFTRAVTKRILDQSELFDINAIDIVDSQSDISLYERVKRANEYALEAGVDNLVYVSIHSNAGGGSGIEVFTSPGQTKSDEIATVFLNKLSITFPEVRKRTDFADGDPDKEANFYVLKKTMMPAVLTEIFFMDNEPECRDFLMSESGRDKIAMAHIAAMVAIERRTNGK
jgi:N-acetylmuramoyl-L-alanine amidase